MPLSSPHAEKVPFANIQAGSKTREIVDVRREKETFNIEGLLFIVVIFAGCACKIAPFPDP